jgi:hypothetical protein
VIESNIYNIITDAMEDINEKMVKSDNTPNVDKLAEMPENVPVPAKPL